jgi:ribosomal protein S7
MNPSKKRSNRLIKKGNKTLSNRIVLKSLKELNRVHYGREFLKDENNGSGPMNQTIYNRDNRSVKIMSNLFEGLKPVIETKSVKRAGISNLIPIPIRDQRGLKRASGWVQEASKKRAKKRGLPFEDARRIELVDIYDEIKNLVQIDKEVEQFGKVKANTSYASVKRQTDAMQMRDRLHRTAKSNRVFLKGKG